MLAGPTKLLHYAETLLLRLSEMCRHLLSRRSPLSFDGATWTAYQRPLVQAKQLLKTGMQKELAEKLLQETLEHLISVNLLSAPLEQHLCDAAVLGVLAFQQAMLRGNASCIRKAASHLAWLCLTVLQTLESHSSEPIPTEDDGALAEVVDVLHGIAESVAPFCFGTTVMLLHELRHLQRVPTVASDTSKFDPQTICDGTWMQKLPGTGVVWLHLHRQDRSVLIVRCVEDPIAAVGSQKLFCHRVPLGGGAVALLEQELLVIQKENRSSLVAHVRRDDCNDDEQRKIYWDARAYFDQRMASLAVSFEKIVLGAWRFLLCTAQPSAITVAAFLRWFTSIPFLPVLPSSATTMGAACLLYAMSANMDCEEVAEVLAALWAPFLVARQQPSSEDLGRSMQEHARRETRSSSPEDLQLLLFVDPALANFPIESCPCLRDCEVVRAVAPNVALRAFERRLQHGPFVPKSGHCIVDPFGDAAFAGKGLRELLTKLEASWTSNIASSAPAHVEEILDLLVHRDAFVYMGHGEGAKKLLRQDRLQLGAKRAGGIQGQSCYRPLSSVVLLMGCSSSKMASLGDDFEAFGLPMSILVGGGPATIGVLWDVLGGDLDTVTCAILRHWLMDEEARSDAPEGAKRRRCSLGKAVVQGRRAASLRNLTGAAVVCYGVPF